MSLRTSRGYRQIADYAVIGDTNTTALVASDGSIDWWCWPRIDSPAVFCRLLDAGKGGWFRVGPVGEYDSTRTYVDDTNVLATTFSTATGRVRLTDFMPIGSADSPSEDHADGGPILRLVEGLAGEVENEVSFRPTFNYARDETHLEATASGAIASAGGECLTLNCPVALSKDESGALSGKMTVTRGDRFWVTLTHQSRDFGRPTDISAEDAEVELGRTLGYWRRWAARCEYEGPYRRVVLRSALVLKLLTYAPTGALVAAPTTSLPEELGGVRNWDYRYTWLRDSALILYSLQSIGYMDETDSFFRWLRGLGLRKQERIQIMYRVDGSEDLPELVLDHLEGYRSSRPVRIGNAAARQSQLDVYGELIDAAHLHLTTHGQADPELWGTIRLLANRAAMRWQEEDAGIWEVRAGESHFLYSKLLCWVAVDRAIRMAEESRLSGELDLWRKTRQAIREAILSEGYDDDVGAFTQALGVRALDASALAIPMVGFLSATDPRVQSTVARIQERLTSDGLVYRYVTPDGLSGGEATFALCTFWLANNLALGGRIDEAREIFERVVSYANDLGLLAEEIDPDDGLLLGNFPQGFTHLALISAALSIAKAEEVGPEERAQTPAERQPDVQRAGHKRRD